MGNITSSVVSRRNIGFMKFIGILVMFLGLSVSEGWGQNSNATFTKSTSGSAWWTNTNWSTGLWAGIKATSTSNTNIATFTSASAPIIGINMGTSSLCLGAISIDNTRTSSLDIGNSSGTTSGTMALYGTVVNSIDNVIIRNNGTGLFTLQASQSSTMGVVLSNSTENIINIDGTGGVTISSIISGSSKNLTKAGSGSGVLTLSGVNSYSGNTTISTGTLALSGSGSIANSPIITIASGATFSISGRTNALTLGSGQSLKSSATGSNTTATLTVASLKDLTLSTGGIAFTAYGGGATAPLTVTGATAGALALNSAPITVTTTTALTAGTYTLIAKSGSATGVSGTPGTLTVNGSGLAANTSGSLSVSSGQLILTVSAPSSDATLSALTVNNGTLSPTFASATTSYTATVPYSTSSIGITPTVNESHATVKINGVDATSGIASTVGLSVGDNVITILVTAQDGTTTKTYTTTVTRTAAATVSTLSGLVLSDGTLSPAFDAGTTTYTASVPYTSSSITVTPTKTNSFASIQVQVNGGGYSNVTSGSASGSLALNVGSNTVDIKVTAEDGTYTTYSTTITREAASTPTLQVSTLTGFGNVCINNTSGYQSFTITGSSLTSANVTVGALSGYKYSTAWGGPYTSTLSLTQPGGSYSQEIFVKLTPTAVQSYNGDIVIGGGGASDVNRSVTGVGVNSAPTVTTTSPATSITSISATLSGNVTDVGCQTITARGICYGTSINPDITGSKSTESGTGGVFSSNISGLSPNTLYYFRAYATSPAGTSYGSDVTFTTAAIGTPTAATATDITAGSFTANWGAVNGASGYKMDVGVKDDFLALTSNTIAGWSFPVSGTIVTPDIASTNNTNKVLSTNGGTISDATGSTTQAPSADQWQSGSGSKYWQIEINTLDFYGIKISSTLRSSNTGPKDFKLQYKVTSSGTWTDVVSGSFTVAANFTTGVLSNLQLNSDCDNQSSVFIRWIMTSNTSVNGGSVASGGTCRIDDILISGYSKYFVGDYNNYSVSGTSQSVTILSPNTTYYYRVRATSTNSTSANSNVITVTTDKAASTISATGATSFTYNGTPQGPGTATVTGSAGTVSYSYSGTGTTTYSASATKPTNAGTYQVVATVAAAGDYYGATSSPLAFTITPAALTISGVTANDKTYDGSTAATLSGTPAYDGLMNGESYSVTGTASATFANANVGSGKTVTVTGYTAPSANYTVSQPTGLIANITAITSTISSSGSIGNAASLPQTDLTVNNGVELIIDQNATVHNISVLPGGKLTLQNGVTLTAPITLQSNGSATATFVDSRSDATPSAITGTVEQRLPQGRNWYITSPVVDGSATSLTAAGLGASVSYWNEAASAWVNDYTGTLQPGVGYIAVSSTGSGTNNASFNGTLHSGPVTVPLTRKGATKAGFNLIANPYPSYLDAMQAINVNANIQKTIWYRTRSTGASPLYKFETVNTTSGEGTNAAGTGTVTGIVPPMQAFWVRTNTDNNSVTFTNAMRYHANPTISGNPVTTTPLKAPAANTATNKLLRLEVAKGTATDETVVYFNPNASVGFDDYDSPKWSNASTAIPELYTIASAETLAINGLPEITYNTELPLGFYAGAESVYSIRAKELRNFDSSTRVILKDGSIEYDLTNGDGYEFNSTAYNSTNRFSIIFRTAGATTGLQESGSGDNVNVFVNTNGELVVRLGSPVKAGAKLAIYNALGQQLFNQSINSELTIANCARTAGVYWVKITNNGETITRKVIQK